MKIKPLYFIPAAIWTIVIYILLVMPSKNIPDNSFLDEIQFDKMVHCGIFATFVFLWSFPLKKKFPHYTFIYLLIAVIALAYGIGMEYVQKYYTNGDRDFDYWDMVADGTGCMIGFLFIQWQLRKISGKKL